MDNLVIMFPLKKVMIPYIVFIHILCWQVTIGVTFERNGNHYNNHDILCDQEF